MGTKTETLPSGETVLVTAADLTLGQPLMIEHDMLLDRRDGRDITKLIRHFYICRDAEVNHFFEWFDRLPRGKNGVRELGWDTETSGIFWRNEKLATEQFGNPVCDDPRSYTICARSLSPEAMARFVAVINDPSVIKYVQNGKFECLYAMYHLGARPKRLVDTQVAELVIRAGLFGGGPEGGEGEGGQNRKAYSMCSMAKLVRRRCGGIDIDKDHDLRTSFYTTPPGEHTTRQIIYAGADTIHPFTIFADQRRDIEARRLRSVLAVEFELIPVIASMEIAGMSFDSDSWIALWQKAVEEQDQIERKLDHAFLSVAQPDLFGAQMDTSPTRSCGVCGGSGKRENTRADCSTCGGTGRTRGSGVRPVYSAGRGKNAHTPLNWGSSTQVKWAIRQYCEALAWPYKLLTTDRQLLDEKKKLGIPWLAKKGKVAFDAEGNLVNANGVLVSQIPDELAEEIPDYVIPEEDYCPLLSADALTLKLRRIRGQLPGDFIDLILKYSETKAKLGTFGRDFLKNVHADGRFRAEFHQAITTTGRLSSQPNAQNIPRDKEYRKCFRAARGRKLIAADFAAQEPRITAQVSGDDIYLQNFLNGGDLYVSIGEKMLGRPIDKKTPEGAKDRQAIKQVVLALAYRSGPSKLRDQLTLALGEPVSFEYAQELHRKFLETCSGVRVFQEACFAASDPSDPKAPRIWDDMLNEAVTWTESVCGRKRFYPPDAKAVYTESANFPIQSLAASQTKSALCLIHREIEARGWVDKAWIVNVIHDEILMEADADIASECAIMLKECMERAAGFYVTVVPVPAEYPEGTDGTLPYWTKS
jgi:DNA polymerase I-like protein with 3'-5' exonuclease and polymerase domains